MSGWFWWVWIFVMLGGAGGITNAVRTALDNRHKRKMAVIRANTQAEEKRQQLLAEANKQPEPVCGCGHHLAKHDRAGKCHEVVELPEEWDARHRPVKFRAGTCTCQQYVGPRPLETLYAEDLVDLSEPPKLRLDKGEDAES